MKSMEFDPELTLEQEKLVSELTDEQLNEIDKALIENSGKYFRKVAMVVGSTMFQLESRVKGVSDVFYAKRVAKLVEEGKLIAQGDLRRMRYSEVKLT